MSYILSGHVPHYNGRHVDALLHQRLHDSTDLLHIDPSLFAHVRSSLRYSSQALPINVVLDALQRPDHDVSDAPQTCVRWLAERQAVNHVVLGEAPRPGGQWTANPVFTTWTIGTLSYAEQLSLPGFSFADFWLRDRHAPLPEFVRPSRTDVADYYAAYPSAVGIDRFIETSTKVHGVSRTSRGFHIASHDLTCDNIVLATGTFSINLPPPPSLSMLAASPDPGAGPVLIVGSGFTAADFIMSTPPGRKIVHVFNWDPEDRPSPLQGCHSSAYPEYSWIYRQMKAAALQQGQDRGKMRTTRFRAVSALPYFNERDWVADYEGFANADIVATASGNSSSDGTPASRGVSIRLPNADAPVYRDIAQLHYATGRRGSLGYLSDALLREVHGADAPLHTRSADPDPWNGPADSRPVSHASPVSDEDQDVGRSPLARDPRIVSGSTLRPRLEESAAGSMELADGVFVVGSLTGDSLVRFALGGCCAVAGRVFDRLGGAATAYASAGVSMSGPNVEGTVEASASAAPEQAAQPSRPQERSAVVAPPHVQPEAREDTRGRWKKKVASHCVVS